MIEKCFESATFKNDLRNSHYKMLQTILTLPDAKNCIAFHTKTALNNLAGPELLEKLENGHPEILSKCKLYEVFYFIIRKSLHATKTKKKSIILLDYL